MPSDAHRSTPVTCLEASAVLPAMVDDQLVDRRLRAHVGTCLRCQADLAQYRRLRRALRRLEPEVVDPGPGLVGAVLADLDALDADGTRTTGRRRGVYIGGVAVGGVAVATAAGAIVWATRRRVGLAS